MAIVHLTWAVALLISREDAFGSTPLSPFQVLVSPWAAVLMITTSVMSLVASGFKNHLIRVMMFLPQQVVLYMSAMASAAAVASGHYADGVMRPPMFILTDQVGTIVLAIAYTIIVIGAADQDG